MNLKQLSKSYNLFDGAATLYMLPYTAHKSSLIVGQISEVIGDAAWGTWDHIFYVFEPYVQDIEFHDTSSVHVKGLEVYWQNRNGDMAHNRELFQECISMELGNVLIQVYNETREGLPGAPEILAHGEPDKRTDPKGGRRGRKSTREKLSPAPDSL